MLQLHLKIIGILFITLALLHLFFPKRFGWKTELASLSLLSRQIMYVHTFFIAVVVLLMGFLCLFCSSDLAATALGHKIAFGLSVFWALRLFVQLFVYAPQLWRGKRFESAIHFLFSLLWSYAAILFFLVARS